MCSAANSVSTRLRPAAPIAARRAGSPASAMIAFASAGASRGGTNRPLPPCRTTSRHPGKSVATIGRPQAAASSSVFGTPSP